MNMGYQRQQSENGKSIIKSTFIEIYINFLKKSTFKLNFLISQGNITLISFFACYGENFAF